MRSIIGLLLALLSAASSAAWQYRTETDPMGGAFQSATTMSTNNLNFSAPYRGPQKATLYLRTHPRKGRDVLVAIEKGQFICNVSGCTLMVRFDQEKPRRFGAVGPTDHSSTVLFIRDYAGFTKALRAAKVVRIEATFYQEGSQVMEFDVAGLDFDKPAPAPKKAAAPSSAADQGKVARCQKVAAQLLPDDRERYLKTCLP